MNPSAKPLYEHGFDEETLAELRELRQLRLHLAREQLARFPDTLADMVRRGLIAPENIEADAQELRAELEMRVETMAVRMHDDAGVYFDEIEFYLGFTR